MQTMRNEWDEFDRWLEAQRRQEAERAAKSAAKRTPEEVRALVRKIVKEADNG